MIEPRVGLSAMITRRGACVLGAAALISAALPVPAYASYGVSDWNALMRTTPTYTGSATVGGNLGYGNGTLHVNHYEVMLTGGGLAGKEGAIVALPTDCIEQVAIYNHDISVEGDTHLDAFICMDWDASCPTGTTTYRAWKIREEGNYTIYYVYVNRPSSSKQPLAALYRIYDTSRAKERVSCDFAGGNVSGATSFKQTGVRGETTKLPEPKREGYVFCGWRETSRSAGAAGAVVDLDDTDGSASLRGEYAGNAVYETRQYQGHLSYLAASLAGDAASDGNRLGGSLTYRFERLYGGSSMAGSDGAALALADDAGNKGHLVNTLTMNVTGGVAEEWSVYFRGCATEHGWLGWSTDGCASNPAASRFMTDAQVLVVPRDTGVIELFGAQTWRFWPTSEAASGIPQANLEAVWEKLRSRIRYYVNGALVATEKVDRGEFEPMSLTRAWELAGRPGSKAPEAWYLTPLGAHPTEDELAGATKAPTPKVSCSEREMELFAVTDTEITVTFAWTDAALAILERGEVRFEGEGDILPSPEKHFIPPKLVWGAARQPAREAWIEGSGGTRRLASENFYDPQGMSPIAATDEIGRSITCYLSLATAAFDTERSFS